MNKKAFSLIEIIIATWILSMTFFWVYKLIWENTKIINNSNNFLQTNTIFYNFKECIKNIWFDYFKNNSQLNYNFNLWNTWTWCYTWNTNITKIDNIEYIFKWNITNSWTNFIDWNLKIKNDEIWEINKNFILLKNN